MKILIFGKGGQVGWELQRSLAPLGEIVALDHDSVGLCGSFTDLPGLVATIRAVAPDVIVNAAAHTAVDKAESEPELARTLNALAPGVLADEAQKLGAWLVHYSTDYVFDGSGSSARCESDPTGPLSVYGQTKLDGEQAAARCARHLIFRTSWVFAARGANFAKTMLRLARERDSLSVIADQIGAPTGAELLADVTAHALRTVCQRPTDFAQFAGVYHLVAAGETSWHGFACHVLERARAKGIELKVAPEAVKAITTADYPTPARRPLNSRLDTTRLRTTFGLHIADWRVAVDRMLEEILI